MVESNSRDDEAWSRADLAFHTAIIEASGNWIYRHFASVIRAALGEDHLIDAMDGYAFGAAQTAILVALVRSDATSAQEVDRFLAAAADQADGYLRQRGLQ